ncbi:GntR family transcriptional regulator [Paracoccus mutanolyticus]|uniref:GntR family transcriptional regulator n=1 Tax=Paracoccus mutanolyticus TaxID=1499308 RepID=UPI001CB92246|nr:GntR family transcriptional regulator [Paracoccus mutanolyticus]
MHALLRRRIVTGDLRPGMRLSEQDIADQYDLSRQPVREAFIRLAAEGLLEVRPQRGTFVTRINMDWVLDTRFIREATEADIVRIATRMAGPAEVGRLRAMIDRQAAVDPGDPARLVALDEESTPPWPPSPARRWSASTCRGSRSTWTAYATCSRP